MGPALSPGAVGQEMAACAVLGGVLGAARAVLPTRGRAAFLPDMLFVGAVLMALQSYAVSQSQAGAAAGLYGAGGVLRRRGGAGSAAASVRRCRSLCGETAAGAGAARRPVHRPVESRPRRRQSTAERKKTCKKTEKELANTTAYVV